MKYPVFAVRDFKVGYLTPTCEANAAAACRNFEHACKNTESLFFSHPEDYALFQIGEYDTDTGVLTPMPPEELISASQAIERSR